MGMNDIKEILIKGGMGEADATTVAMYIDAYVPPTVLKKYKPAEPLIKDEKVRKAVRAWAEANGIVKAFIITFSDMWKVYGDDAARNRFTIEFSNRIPFDEDEVGRDCTITELCGEEEE